jgi:putative redox protein
MIATLEWKEGLTFEAQVPSGVDLVFDSADDGEIPKGPSPMEAFLTSLAACTAMDVISILEKKRQKVASYRIEIEGDRNPPGSWPRPFTEFRIKHSVTGEVDPVALQRAINLSEETYCSVSATLKAMPKVVNTWEIT